MSFPTGSIIDHQKIGAGECYGDTLVQTADTFENGLVVGVFAKLDTGSLDNLDSSATPVIAGVVLRDIASPVEDGAVYNTDLYKQVDYAVHNYVSVQAVSGQTPDAGDAIYAENQTPADYGKATTTSGGNADADAVFVKLIDEANDVWQIRFK